MKWNTLTNCRSKYSHGILRLSSTSNFLVLSSLVAYRPKQQREEDERRWAVKPAFQNSEQSEQRKPRSRSRPSRGAMIAHTVTQFSPPFERHSHSNSVSAELNRIEHWECLEWANTFLSHGAIGCRHEMMVMHWHCGPNFTNKRHPPCSLLPSWIHWHAGGYAAVA